MDQFFKLEPAHISSYNKHCILHGEIRDSTEIPYTPCEQNVYILGCNTKFLVDYVWRVSYLKRC